jgi:hypothetical protein
MQLFAIGFTPLQPVWYDLPRHTSCEPYLFLAAFSFNRASTKSAPAGSLISFTGEQGWILSQHLERFKEVAMPQSTLDIFLLILAGGSYSRGAQPGCFQLVPWLI